MLGPAGKNRKALVRTRSGVRAGMEQQVAAPSLPYWSMGIAGATASPAFPIPG